MSRLLTPSLEFKSSEFLEGIHPAGDVGDVFETEGGEVFAGFGGAHSGLAVDDDPGVLGEVWGVGGDGL